jgi:hypothetical protein
VTFNKLLARRAGRIIFYVGLRSRGIVRCSFPRLIGLSS